MVKKKYLLSFTPAIVNEPLTYKMIKEYDLLVNILRAEVSERGGRLLIEVEGKPSQMNKGISFLKDAGVEVRELNEYVNRDEDRCTDCGACLSICPADAFEMDKQTWKVLFKGDRCIACGLCIDTCPPRAMKLRIW
ncbi:MAG: 4Fe-4S binding protein [Methanomassiliicoccales archaeon]|jgi:NAD-dependent dihydropyrimidine dehydrogenase PreA subunit|nr:4Fe-4S binding protein [Methanomassiliicoccales archaeon]